MKPFSVLADFFFFNRDIRYRNSVDAVRLWQEQPGEDRDSYIEALIGELAAHKVDIDLSYRLHLSTNVIMHVG